MKSRIVAIVLSVVGLALVVFVSYKQPPISYLGGESAPQGGQNENEDFATLVAPIGVFKEGQFKELESSVGKRIELKQFSDSELLEKLSQSIGVDVVAFRNDYAHRLYSRSLLQRFDTNQVPNIETRYVNLPFASWAGYKTGSGPAYSIPYLARMSGIIAKSDLVPPDGASWKIFLDPRLHGKVGATSLGDMVWLTAVVSRIDLSLFSEDISKALKDVTPACKRLMGNEIRLYDTSASMLNELAAGRIDAAMVDEREGRSFAGSHPGFVFLPPKEGMVAAVYCLCVPVRVKSSELAYKIVDAMFAPVFAATLHKSGSGLVLVTKAEGELNPNERTAFTQELQAFDKAITFPNLNMESQQAFDVFVEQLSAKRGGSES